MLFWGGLSVVVASLRCQWVSGAATFRGEQWFSLVHDQGLHGPPWYNHYCEGEPWWPSNMRRDYIGEGSKLIMRTALEGSWKGSWRTLRCSSLQSLHGHFSLHSMSVATFLTCYPLTSLSLYGGYSVSWSHRSSWGNDLCCCTKDSIVLAWSLPWVRRFMWLFLNSDKDWCWHFLQFGSTAGLYVSFGTELLHDLRSSELVIWSATMQLSQVECICSVCTCLLKQYSTKLSESWRHIAQ